MLKKIFISIIILCSLQFYEMSLLGGFTRMFHLMGIGIILLLIIVYGVYDSSLKFKPHFTIFIIIILLSLPTSMYIAKTQHNQSIPLSLIGQRHMYYYFMYFAAHALKTRPKDIERLFLYFGILFIGLYFMQMVAFPTKIFSVTIFKDRGTIRIFLPGLTFMVFGYFYTLQNFLEKNNVKYLIFNFLSLIIVILLGSRSLLLVVLLVTIINLLVSRRIKSRALIYMLAFVGAVLIGIIFKNIFVQLIEATEQTRRTGMENVRIRAAIFYLTHMFPNGLSYIFGNGVASGESEYAGRIFVYTSKYGFYLSDIGIIGNYITYGVLFVAGVLGLLWRVYKTKVESSLDHIKYFFLFVFLALPTGGGFSESELIVVVCLSLYVLDVGSYFNKKQEQLTN
ncbi:MAG: hypothetical protein JSV22_13760 [Bacteroidales bacterium]|nr:MAG: hypothetical protein JSV22_13760 [Bacteroidales bacterium]